MYIARTDEKGQNALAELAKLGLKARYIQLDMCKADSIEKCAKQLKSECGKVDILINNAAVCLQVFVLFFTLQCTENYILNSS